LAASSQNQFCQSTTHPVLTIDLDAIVRNLEHFRRVAPHSRVYGVVKADAYGLGAERIAVALAAANADGLCVALIEEAVSVSEALRRHNLSCPILILNGVSEDSVEDVAHHGFIPVLNSVRQLNLWASRNWKSGKPLPAVLHIDTGMNRLGLSASELSDAIEATEKWKAFPLHFIMSHLACADEPEHPLNDIQKERFKTVLASLPPAPASLANSAGALLGSAFHFDVIRPGIGLYGGVPSEGDLTFEPVVRFEAPILQIRDVDKAQTVGYGASYRANKAVRVATVAAGYADGYMRKLGNNSHGYIGDQRIPVVGRVSMDLLTLDVTEVMPKNCQPGTMVQLLGNKVTVNDLALAAETIPYEILTRLGRRGTRIYKGGPTPSKDAIT